VRRRRKQIDAQYAGCDADAHGCDADADPLPDTLGFGLVRSGRLHVPDERFVHLDRAYEQ
jgi:hypothetical protein